MNKNQLKSVKPKNDVEAMMVNLMKSNYINMLEQQLDESKADCHRIMSVLFKAIKYGYIRRGDDGFGIAVPLEDFNRVETLPDLSQRVDGDFVILSVKPEEVKENLPEETEKTEEGGE